MSLRNSLMIGVPLIALAMAGCQSTKSPSLVMLPEGYKIVAQGKQPIGFYLNQPGEMIVTDLTTGNAVYSMDSSATHMGATDAMHATIKLEDGRLVAQSSESESNTILAGLDVEHSYRIVFRPSGPTTKPTTLPVLR